MNGKGRKDDYEEGKQRIEKEKRKRKKKKSTVNSPFILK